MSEPTTYAFLDSSIVINHPSYGAHILNGEGIGQLTIDMAGDVSAHDVAADGAVMIPKIAQNNGSVTIEVQQTSEAYKYMLGLYNYLKGAATSEWATASIKARNISDGTSHYLKGVSPQKKPTKIYGKQGQNISFTFLAADIQSETA